MKSNTVINTHDGARISKRLLNHWKHKFEVSEIEQVTAIMMPNATILLTPSPENLHVQIDSRLADNSHLENVVLAHLNRMAKQEFEATWTH